MVKSGDTLSRLAAARGVAIAEIKRLNQLRDDAIRIGQRLRLPPEGQQIRAGDLKVAGLSRRRWRNIVVHHSATANGNAKDFDAYHRDVRHMENGLAYHFLVGNGLGAGDGEVQIGPRWKKQLAGGHVSSRSYNESSLGICLVGNFEKTRPTQRQMIALKELITCLRDDVLEREPRLVLHRDLKGEHTLCPGRNFPVDRFQAGLA